MTGLTALRLCRAHGVRTIWTAEGVVFEAMAEPPADVIAAIDKYEDEINALLACREAARATLAAECPAGARKEEWAEVMRGLQRFVAEGWGDQAGLLGWSGPELYRLPVPWCRVDRAGGALFVGDRQVIAVSAESIVIKVRSGSTLRIARERLA